MRPLSGSGHFGPGRGARSGWLRWRWTLTAALTVVTVLAVAAYLLDRLAAAEESRPDTVPAGRDPAPSADRSEPPKAVSAPRAGGAGQVRQPLMRPGPLPEDGPGRHVYAPDEGEVLGESGAVLRFRVAVEENVADGPVDLTDVTGFVDETLGAEEGWTAGGDRRFRRVPGDAGHDFTIYLVTSGTAARMCGAVGLDVIGSGLPEGGVSCRARPGEVVLNLHRWQLSVPHFVEAEVPLVTYRQMLLNHEVGHQLGFGHEGCPGQGEPAPVMQQQTLRLDGCEPYPWPYRDGERHTGPSVP